MTRDAKPWSSILLDCDRQPENNTVDYDSSTFYSFYSILIWSGTFYLFYFILVMSGWDRGLSSGSQETMSIGLDYITFYEQGSLVIYILTNCIWFSLKNLFHTNSLWSLVRSVNFHVVFLLMESNSTFIHSLHFPYFDASL